jgi:hypothetical protein
VTVFFLIGFGKWKIPQFVMPRTTPPEFRTMLPVVFAILCACVREMKGDGKEDGKDGLADLGEVAGADLEGLLASRFRLWSMEEGICVLRR